jgi:MFS family permease
MSRTRAASGANRHLGLTLVVIATAQLMVVLDTTIVNVALPHIQRALRFSGSGLEWVVNAYALSFGELLLLGGRAGDLLGRRRAQPVLGRLGRGRLCYLPGVAAGRAGDPGHRRRADRPATLALIVTTFAEARRGTGR